MKIDISKLNRELRTELSNTTEQSKTYKTNVLFRIEPSYTRTILGPMAIVGADKNKIYLRTKTVYIAGQGYDHSYSLDSETRALVEIDSKITDAITRNDASFSNNYVKVCDHCNDSKQSRLVQLLLMLILDDRVDGRKFVQALNKCGYKSHPSYKITRLHNGGMSFSVKANGSHHRLSVVLQAFLDYNED